MSRPLRIQYPGAVYHITHRGNDRKQVFKDDADRHHFLKLLSLSLDTYNVTLHAFVLMSNHFHLLAETPLGNLSEFMRHLNISYTSYFNRRHKRSGHLFQGRFKSFIIDKDAYLLQVSRYIHLNPVCIRSLKNKPTAERKKFVSRYHWSSLPGHFAVKKQFAFVEYGVVLADLGGNNPAGRRRYKRLIMEDLDGSIKIRKRVIGQSILGDSNFVRLIKEKYLPSKADRECPAIDRIQTYEAPDKLLKILSDKLQLSRKKLLSVKGVERQITMDILYRYGGMTNPRIGKMMGVDYSTVSQGRKRLREKSSKDKKLKKIILAIEKLCQE